MSNFPQRLFNPSRRRALQTLAGLPIAAGAGIRLVRAAGDEKPAGPPRVDCDVFVYGSTPGGIGAAVEAARRGLKVVLACPQKHPGGMAASGLCTTDAVRRHLFGGMVAEFVGRVRADYVKTLGEQHPDFGLIKDGWYYEPSVAQRVFDGMLVGESERLDYRRGTLLTAAAVERGRISQVGLEGPDGTAYSVAARTYIDGTYEGDLAAKAKAPYVVGREGRDEFDESMAGIHYMNWRTGKQIMTADTGEPSPAIQAFCARCVLTVDPEKRSPIEKPATYEEHLPDYLPLLDDFAAGRLKRWSGGTKFPGGKREFNGNIEWRTSLNLPGVSWNWPEAEPQHRARLAQFHVDHAAGLFWFLQNDPHVPEAIREQMKPLGRHPDEFVDNGGWPWQIYVRQGRRIRGRAIVTQNNFIVDPKSGKTPTVEQPIALGEHSFDVHPCHDRRFAVEGFMEGVLWYPKKAFGPAQPGQIPWGALLPRGVDNLVVPVALSCTHVAMSVLRMEPVWMTLGQIAGLAAAVAKEQSTDVARIDPEPLPVALKIPTVPG
jgi:hypothetical protein